MALVNDGMRMMKVIEFGWKGKGKGRDISNHFKCIDL